MTTKNSLWDYFKSHVRPIYRTTNLFMVDKDLKVFKKVKARSPVKGEAIANLIIPKGAIISYDHFNEQPELSVTDSDKSPTVRVKMRASMALVDSIARISDGRRIERAGPYSYIKAKITYRPEELVRPDYFSVEDKECAPGIHFFLTLKEAIDYV